MKSKVLFDICCGISIFYLILLSTSVHIANTQEQSLHSIPRERIDIPISNLTIGWTDSRNLFVSGTAINNSTYNLDNVLVDVSIFDENKELINEEKRSVIPPDSILEAGSDQKFRFFIIAEGAVNYNISAFGSKVSALLT